jgi:hypothetical protein
MGSFTDGVSGWCSETEERLLAVFQQSVILLARELQKTVSDGGTLPKVTGNLMRSLLAQIGSMPAQGGAEQTYAGADVGSVVAQALIGSEIYLGFQANYARRRNFGYVGTRADGTTWEEAGAHFVERAAKLWPECVRQAVQDVKNGVGA